MAPSLGRRRKLLDRLAGIRGGREAVAGARTGAYIFDVVSYGVVRRGAKRHWTAASIERRT
jgi:hypothetical protein